MQMMISFRSDDAAIAVMTEPQTSREIASRALRSVADEIETGVSCDFIAQVVDDGTEAVVARLHVTITGGL